MFNRRGFVRTMATASLSGLTPMHPQWDLPFDGFAKAPAPYWYGAKAAGYGDIGEDEFGVEVARRTERSSARSARIVLGHSPPNRCRARAASSSRREPIGRRCRAS